MSSNSSIGLLNRLKRRIVKEDTLHSVKNVFHGAYLPNCNFSQNPLWVMKSGVPSREVVSEVANTQYNHNLKIIAHKDKEKKILKSLLHLFNNMSVDICHLHVAFWIASVIILEHKEVARTHTLKPTHFCSLWKFDLSGSKWKNLGWGD